MNTKGSVVMWLGALACILLLGCSSTLEVKEANPGGPIDGVPFYLSKPYLVITKYFVMFEGKPEELLYSTEEVVYMPDRKKLYTANYKPAPFASADFKLTYGDQPGSVVKEISMKSVPPSPKELAEAATKLFAIRAGKPDEWPQFLINLTTADPAKVKNVRVEIEIKELKYPVP